MLKQLEVSGFKSFAKKGLLEFKTPISAIVVPNGSGKSNVAESFRFVLGEQSLKSMRGKRGEDLIFSGSKNERPMNRSSVKVTFDNRKKFLNIDYDDVIIERVVRRDGVNQYFINGSQVRLKDVTELLVGANIGASGHHIISQGESDRILNVNPKERKGMIEDALGLKIYQYKILESEKKLDKTEENIKSVHSLKKEIKPHLSFLKKQVSKIEESIEMRDELRGLYKEYFKREDEYLEDKKNYIQVNKKPLIKKMVRLDEELFNAREVLANENKKDENKEILETESDLKKVRERKSELSREIGKIEGMVTFEERRLKKEGDRQKENKERMIGFREVKNFTDDLDSQLDKYQGLTLVEKIREKISEFIIKNTEQNTEQKTEQKDKEELDKLLEEKFQLEKKIKEIISEEEIFIKKYEVLKEEVESEKDSNRQAELKVFEINAKQSEMRSELNYIENLEKRVDRDEEDLRKELNEAFILVGRDSIQFMDIELPEDFLEEDRYLQEDRKRKIEKIKIKLEDIGGGSGEEIIKEYKEVKERDDFLEREISDLEQSAVSIKELISELKEELDSEFKEGIKKINLQFNEFFNLMFDGGRAKLSVVRVKKRKKNDFEGSPRDVGIDFNDEDENYSVISDDEGIEVDVSLPNKKTKGLQMLSGGERSLTSIALLFAMSQINPPPFIVLDETDAALDEANSRRYGDMIENLSKYSQLILITHNRETMSRAGVLYGITMGMDGVSRLLSVKLEEAVKVAK